RRCLCARSLKLTRISPCRTGARACKTVSSKVMSKAELETRIQQWLETNHEIVHNPPLGANQCSIEFEKARQRGIFDELNKIGSKELSRQVKDKCALNVDYVRDNIVSLDYIGKIANLEGLFSSATVEVLGTAHQLSSADIEALGEVRKPLLGSVQRCWQWTELLSTLTRLHLKNAADYNDFHVECHDAGERLTRNFSHALRQLECIFHLTPSERTKRLLTTLTDSLKHSLTDWEAVERLLVKSHSIVPVAERLGRQRTSPIRAVCACKYETPKFRLSEGEEVVVLDNSDKHLWRVALNDGCEVQVPSIIVWIPPCDLFSVDKGVNLRKKLSDMWTDLLERFRTAVVAHLNSVFSQFLERRAPIKVSNLSRAQELFDLIESTILADEPTDGVQLLARLLAEVKARTIHKDDLDAALGRDPRLRNEPVHFPTTELVRLHTIVSKLWQHLRHWTEFQEAGALPHYTRLPCVQHGLRQRQDSDRQAMFAEQIGKRLADNQDELLRLQNNLNALSGPPQCRTADEPAAAPPLIGHLDLGQGPPQADAHPGDATTTSCDAATDTGSLTELLMQLLIERRDFARTALRRDAKQREADTQTAKVEYTERPQPSCNRVTDMGGFAQVKESSTECQLALEQLVPASATTGSIVRSVTAYCQTDDSEFVDIEAPVEIEEHQLAMAQPVESSDAFVRSGPSETSHWNGQVGTGIFCLTETASQAENGALGSRHQQMQSGQSAWQSQEEFVVARGVYTIDASCMTDSAEECSTSELIVCHPKVAVAGTQSGGEQAVQSCQASVETFHTSARAHPEVGRVQVLARQPSIESNARIYKETMDVSVECSRKIEDAESAWIVATKDTVVSIQPARAMIVESECQTDEIVTYSLETQCRISTTDSSIQNASEMADFEAQVAPNPLETSSIAIQTEMNSKDGNSQTEVDLVNKPTEHTSQQTDSVESITTGLTIIPNSVTVESQYLIACVDAGMETVKIDTFDAAVEATAQVCEASTEPQIQLSSSAVQTTSKSMRDAQTEFQIETADDPIQRESDVEEIVETYVPPQQAVMPIVAQNEDFSSQTEVYSVDSAVQIDRQVCVHTETDTGRIFLEDSVRAPVNAEVCHSSAKASPEYAEAFTQMQLMSTEIALQWEIECKDCYTESKEEVVSTECIGLQTQVLCEDKETICLTETRNACEQTEIKETINMETMAQPLTQHVALMWDGPKNLETLTKVGPKTTDTTTNTENMQVTTIEKETVCFISTHENGQQTDQADSIYAALKVGSDVADAELQTESLKTNTSDKETEYEISLSDGTGQTEIECDEISTKVQPLMTASPAMYDPESSEIATQTAIEVNSDSVRIGSTSVDAETFTTLRLEQFAQQTDSTTVADQSTEMSFEMVSVSLQTDEEEEIPREDKFTHYDLSLQDSGTETISEIDHADVRCSVETSDLECQATYDMQDTASQTLQEVSESVALFRSELLDASTITDTIEIERSDKETEYEISLSDGTGQTEIECDEISTKVQPLMTASPAMYDPESSDIATQTAIEVNSDSVRIGSTSVDAETFTTLRLEQFAQQTDSTTVADQSTEMSFEMVSVSLQTDEEEEIPREDKFTHYDLSLQDSGTETISEIDHADVRCSVETSDLECQATYDMQDTASQNLQEVSESVALFRSELLDASTITDTIEIERSDKETEYEISLSDGTGQTEIECDEISTKVQPLMTASPAMYDPESSDIATQTAIEVNSDSVRIGSTSVDAETFTTLRLEQFAQQTDSTTVADQSTEMSFEMVSVSLQTDEEEEIPREDKFTHYDLSLQDSGTETISEIDHADVRCSVETSDLECQATYDMQDTASQNLQEVSESVALFRSELLDASTITDTIEIERSDKETEYEISLSDGTGQTEIECDEISTKVQPLMTASPAMYDPESSDIATQTAIEVNSDSVRIGSTSVDAETFTTLRLEQFAQQTDSTTVADQSTEMSFEMVSVSLQTDEEEEIPREDKFTHYDLSLQDSGTETISEIDHADVRCSVETSDLECQATYDMQDTASRQNVF
ncbi:hypothetical protein BOX15_Mlig019862g1, partial [Macrostomum lignano]